MFRWACFAFSVLLVGEADVPVVLHLKPPVQKQVEFPPDQNLPLLPDLGQIAAPPAQKTDAKTDAKATAKPAHLQPESRLAIIRFVFGEFAKAIRPLPAGKKGFRILAGKPLDDKALRMAVSSSGPAVNTGDQVQITRLEFRDREIVFDLNGGGKKKTRLRDRIQVSLGTSGPMPGVSAGGAGSAAPGYQGNGSTLYLDFGKPIPDMTPDELKQFLGAILDFSKQRSAAVQWVQTLPPEIQQAIKDKKVIAGMSQEEVVAAVGKPERRVRERDATGTEVEDWIYGRPPDKMTFVTFLGDKVVRVREYNN
jgi:hypothetical protein